MMSLSTKVASSASASPLGPWLEKIQPGPLMSTVCDNARLLSRVEVKCLPDIQKMSEHSVVLMLTSCPLNLKNEAVERKALLSKSERTSDPRFASLEAENKTLREDLEVVTKSKAALEE